jgi:hypothetical protein
MGNPTLDFGTSFAKPAFAEFIRAHEAVHNALHRTWLSAERSLADPIKRRNVVRLKFVVAPAPPAPRDTQSAPVGPQPSTLYKRARDLAGTVFPVSEAVILDAARKAGIGRKMGRSILFSPADIDRLYEALPCPSSSSAVQNPLIGTSVAPSAESAMKRARALLTSDKPKSSARSVKPKLSSNRSTVIALPPRSPKRS